MITKYKLYNESIRDKMTPKSEEEVRKSLAHLSKGDKLLKACRMGILWVVKELVEEGIQVNRAGSYALELAILYNQYEIVEYLINHGSYVPDRFIDEAKERGNKKIIDLLLKHKNKSTNESVRDKMTPKSKEEIEKSLEHLSPNELLKVGYENKMWDVVKSAIEKGANIHLNDDYTIREACFWGELEVVKYLVEHNANYRIWGGHCLFLACQRGNLELIKYLLDLGINPDSNNKVPLNWAIEHRKFNVIKFLLENGATVTIDMISFSLKINNKEIYDLLKEYFDKQQKALLNKK